MKYMKGLFVKSMIHSKVKIQLLLSCRLSRLLFIDMINTVNKLNVIELSVILIDFTKMWETSLKYIF
jgi:hypothetical protein